MHTFKALGLTGDVLNGVISAGYTTPTPIQTEAIPVACAGRDLIGCAQTGTGKTAAFVLPLLDRLAGPTASRRGRRPRALVLTPTRELALQVEAAIRTYGQHTRLRSLVVYGGAGLRPQIERLRQGTDIVVATPGRLLDLMNRGHADLSQVACLVLDEADRMLDMGFIHDIRKIVAGTPATRQTMLFSATMSRDVQHLARSIMKDDTATVKVGEQRNPAETVTQHACLVPNPRKMDLLVHVLENEPVQNVLVFSRTKRRADRITRQLVRRGFSATALHANKSQNQRQRALDGFRQGRFQILVATDVAARGLDVDTISHVINYDTPSQVEDYIHRIGRTGRAEATGDALTFVSGDERGYLRSIERHTSQRLPRKVYDGFTPETDREDEPTEPRRTGYHAPRSRRRRNRRRR
ncbi:MAG: ATP-dependent RNA helicase RhlE [Rhodothermaceae bacterium]|nr:MAG: ATP-dependent RNA helicase RhlE [Rhodothermaceae bacterium]